MTDALRAQIEAAFDYRGHVTVSLSGGEKVEGFLFNRIYDNPVLPEDNFVELLLKDGGRRRRIPMAEIAAIELTGEDTAAGKSYEDYLKKKQDEQTKP